MTKIQFSLYKQVRRLHQPKFVEVRKYIKNSLVRDFTIVNIDVNIVSQEVSRFNNFQYRSKDCPTNVISLEYAGSADFNLLYGELILCDDIIATEAINQGKLVSAHYAHMIVHGVLHLQGLDHKEPSQASYMEQLETEILHNIGFNNPYII